MTQGQVSTAMGREPKLVGGRLKIPTFVSPDSGVKPIVPTKPKPLSEMSHFPNLDRCSLSSRLHNGVKSNHRSSDMDIQ